MEHTHTNRFEKAAKAALYVFAALMPVWFLPLPVGVEVGREITFGILIIIAGILWLLSILTTGELRFQSSPILYAMGLVLIVFGISTFLSTAPWVSGFLADPVGERFASMLLGIFLFMLLGGLLRRSREIGIFTFITIFAGAVSALVNFIQLVFTIPLYQRLVSFAQGIDFNAIGTQNGLAVYYAILLGLGLGLLTSTSLKKWRWWVRYALAVSLVLFLANLIVIDSQISWIIVLGTAIFLFGLISKNEGAKEKTFDWKNWISLTLLIVAIVMLMIRGPVIRTISLPAEVSPSFRTTLDIGLHVFKEGAKSLFFGSGPGTFGIDWSKYKDPSINQTIFWNLRFNQGHSWLDTLVPTTGVLGAIAFAVFLLVCLGSFLKQLFLPKNEEINISVSLFLGFVALLLTTFLYPVNFSLVMLFFMIAGLLSVYLSTPQSEHEKEENVGFWNITEEKIRFVNPWSVFISSLLVIFLISIGVTCLYVEAGRIRSVLAFQKGIDLLNKGSLDAAIAEFDNMTTFDENNFRNYQMLVQARMEKIKNLVQRANNGENVQQEFQSTISVAIQNAQKAIQLYPVEPTLWRTQGTLYELIIPFIQGSERFAFDSYQKTAQLDPFNPSIWVDLGRSGLAFADRLRLLENQASAGEKDQLDKLKITVLEESEKALQKSAEIKPDYAPAHFLLAQTAIRQGNAQNAIRSAENAKLAAPFDIGVSFQLGLLYYQSNDLARAQSEFERTVSLNANYSNARYFLGLIYDRKGDKTSAIEQFKKVAELNPDNQEVKKILDNLTAGKSALTSIVPPAASPEKRASTPIEEKEQSSPLRTLRRKR